MKVSPFLIPIVFIIALLGTVFAAQRMGLWSTSGRVEVAPQQLAPADIKGWMTLQQVIDGVGISQEVLYRVTGIPASVPATTALKDLEEVVPNFSVTALRTAVQEAVTPLQSR